MVIPSPARLRVEHLENPLGIDTPTPRLSWVLRHPDRGQFETTYRILVSSSEANSLREVGDLWDTGKAPSGECIYVEYGGKPLQKCRPYFWRVKWWDGQDRESPFSEPASFETGLLGSGDWKARWITKTGCKKFYSQGSVLFGMELGAYVQTHALYFRKEVRLKEKVRRARAYICGLGLYELWLNGQRVGDRVLDPGQTDYRKVALYSTLDITGLLKRENAFGVILGNGRHIKNYGYGPPRMILQIHVEYENGNEEVHVSDDTWKVDYGPLMENGLFYGERYDARKEKPGWARPHFDDRSWDGAVEMKGFMPRAQMIPPIRVTDVLKPRGIYSPSSGTLIYDFGQNLSGWVRMKVRGARGTTVKLRHAELVKDDGTLNPSPNQNAEAADCYIMKGGGLEVYEPRFTYHGFRYVEVTGFPSTPELESMEACFVHTDVERTGEFICSNDLINRIHRNILWGQLSNLMSVPTDCPQRDERYGWMADAHLAAEQSMFNFDMAAFFTKFLKDIQFAQHEDGSLPDAVPLYIGNLYPADPAWGSAYITIAWQLYLYYGNKEVLEAHYDSLKRYVDFLDHSSEKHLQLKLGKYGDWCPPGSIVPVKTSVELTSTWYYYHDTMLLFRIARILGREEDALAFEELAREIRKAYNEAYLKDGTSFSQTAGALALYLDMVPKDGREAMLNRLVESLVLEGDYHLDTGILGTRYLLDVLSEVGFGYVAYRVATKKTYPGWGYMVEEGATTLWERWENITGSGMNSHNHIMLGSVDAWFYRTVAGLTCASPGWRRIRFRPPRFDGLDSAEAAVNTVRGEVLLSWRRRTGTFEMTAIVPVGTEAEVHVPVMGEDCVVQESERTIWQRGTPIPDASPHLSCRGREGGYLVLMCPSGYYRFEVSGNP